MDVSDGKSRSLMGNSTIVGLLSFFLPFGDSIWLEVCFGVPESKSKEMTLILVGGFKYCLLIV
jgi:hypothetical protein